MINVIVMVLAVMALCIIVLVIAILAVIISVVFRSATMVAICFHCACHRSLSVVIVAEVVKMAGSVDMVEVAEVQAAEVVAMDVSLSLSWWCLSLSLLLCCGGVA